MIETATLNLTFLGCRSSKANLNSLRLSFLVERDTASEVCDIYIAKKRLKCHKFLNQKNMPKFICFYTYFSFLRFTTHKHPILCILWSLFNCCKIRSQSVLFSRFHLVLLFWNQIFIWSCWTPTDSASSVRRSSDKYLFPENSDSNSSSCCFVYAVRIRRFEWEIRLVEIELELVFWVCEIQCVQRGFCPGDFPDKKLFADNSRCFYPGWFFAGRTQSVERTLALSSVLTFRFWLFNSFSTGSFDFVILLFIRNRCPIDLSGL